MSAIQLAAMIYYNRGVDLLAAQRFAEAADANSNALRLDPQNAVARGNLLATLNNWSIALGNAQQYAAAVGCLRQGLAIDPKFAPLRKTSSTSIAAGPNSFPKLVRSTKPSPPCAGPPPRCPIAPSSLEPQPT